MNFPLNSILRTVRLTLMILLLNSIGLSAQECTPSPFLTQADINNFATNYPGCTCMVASGVNNRVHIVSSNIVDLQGLAQVTQVKGKLDIENTNIVSLFGLHNLDTITNGLVFQNNDLISNFSDLNNLSYLKNLTVYDNENLINFSGLDGLSLLDIVSISNNPNLTSLTGLEGVTQGFPNVNYSSNGYMNLSIVNNTNLVNLDGLINYTGGAQVYFGENASLTNINGINNFAPCVLALSIENNPQLAICNNDAICELLTKGYNWGSNIYDITSNAPGCNSESDILANCNAEDFYHIDTTIYFCAGTTYEWNGVTYDSDTILCESQLNGESGILNNNCLDIRCTRLLTSQPYVNNTAQVGCDINGEAEWDQFGRGEISFNSDGSRLAISGFQNDGNGMDAGHVMVYEFNGGTWEQLGNDINGPSSNALFGHSLELSADGNTIVIGAYGTNLTQVFEFNGNDWIQKGQDITGGTWFGFSASISNDGNRVATLQISGNQPDGSNGLAKVYEFIAGQWTQIGGDLNFLEFMGGGVRRIKLSGDGNRVALSSTTTGQNGFGNTQIFEFNNTDWLQLGQTINQEQPFDLSGHSISISFDGSTLAVGEPGLAGQVRVFNYDGNNWMQLGSDINSFQGSNFGRAVALSDDGTKLLIGQEGYDVQNFGNTGALWTYEFNGLDWDQSSIGYFGDNNQFYFGTTIDISNNGNLIAGGAPNQFVNGENLGIVRVFQCNSENFISADTTIYLCQGEAVEIACETYDSSVLVCENRTMITSLGEECYQYCTEVIVAPTYNITLDTLICEGENILFNGMTLSNDTSFCVNLQSVFGCDSTTCLNLTIQPTILTSESSFICQGDPLESTPSVSNTFTASTGCDSTHTINYTVVDTFYNVNNVMICEGESYDFNGQILMSNTTVCQSFPSIFGCDSTECVVLTVTDALVVQSAASICEGETYDFDGMILDTDTTVCISYMNGVTCDSTHCLTLTVLDTVVTNSAMVLCQGETFTYGGNSASTDEVLCATFTGANTCDSTHCISVSFLDTMFVTELASICPGETVPFNGNFISNDTTICLTTLGVNGCDSTYCLEISLLDVPNTSETTTICEGEFYTWNGNDYSADILLCDTLIGSNTCDSIHCIQLSVLDTFWVDQQENICAGEAYIFDGNVLSTDTSLCITYTATNGCDSTHCVAVSVADTSLLFLNPTICNGETFSVGNSDYTTAGIFTDVLTAANGCDSTIITTLNILDNPGVDISIGDDICEGGTTTLDAGVGYTAYSWSTGAMTQSIETGVAGIYSVIVTDNNGCTTETSIDFGGPVSLQSDLVIASDYNGFEISCADAADGMVEGNVSGGTEPYGFVWSNGSTDANLNNLTSGTYAVTITDMNGCTVEDQVSLMAPEAVTIETEIGSPDCFGDDNGFLIFTPISGALPYTYSLNDGTSQSYETFSRLEAGDYDLIATDANGCVWQETINIPSPPAINLSVTPSDTLLQLGDSIFIEAITATSTEDIQWSPTTYLTCDTCMNNTVTPFENIRYQVTAVDSNGCEVFENVTIRVGNKKLVYIPNVFSPNGDGVNDLFMINASTGVERILTFKVFNRWGKVVFEASDFPPNDPTYSWGSSLDLKDQEGVYVYFVEVKYVNGESEILSGDVTLIR